MKINDLPSINEKTRIYIINGIFYFLVILATALFFRFFHNYYSYDHMMHLSVASVLYEMPLDEMAEMELPIHAIVYPLYHIVVKCVAWIIGVAKIGMFETRYLLSTAIVQVAAIFCSIFLYRILILRLNERKWTTYLFADIVSLAAVIFVVARCWLNQWRFYQLQCAPNPVHNPTILFVRPFGIMAFIFFADFLQKYELKKKYIFSLFVFSVFLLASVWAKPNFAFVFLGAMGIVTLIKMIQWKEIRVGIFAFIAVVPSMLSLLYQFIFMSTKTAAVSIRFQIGGFSNFSILEIICVSLVTFPVPLIMFSYSVFKKNNCYKIAMIALVMGWFQMFFLTNGSSGDFSWGYDLAVQMATVITLACVNGESISKWRKCLGYLLFSYQTMCGLQYIYVVYRYGDFWI